MKQRIVLGLACIWLGCLTLLSAVSADVGAEVEATVVWYLEREDGSEAFRVRYIVTPEYLRSDEGGHGEGYVLLIRKDKQIYNVVPDNRSVMQIDGKGSVPGSPATLSVEVRESVDRQAPTLEGKSAVTLELFADGELCRTAVVVPGLLDEMRQALAEFQQVLAVQQARTLDNTPEEFRTPCFLAGNIYNGGYQLQRGIPLIERGGERLSKELLEYKRDVVLPGSLFELPQDYRKFHVPAE